MRRILRGLGWGVIAAVALAFAYAGYVSIGSARIADNQVLEVSGGGGALEAGAEYSLISWNLGFGAFSADYSFFMDGGEQARALSKAAVEENTGAMIERLLKWDADFALLQEIDLDSDRSYHVNQRAMIGAAFPARAATYALNYDSPYLFYPPSEPIGRSVAGLMTLSRAGISSALRRSLPLEEDLGRLLDLDRCYSVARIPTANGRELCLYNLHLSAYASDKAIGNAQIAMLLSDMAAEHARGNYALAAGDFNKDLLGAAGGQLPWAQPFPTDLLPESLSLAAPTGVPSCRNADAPYARGQSFTVTIDGFLLSENIELRAAEVLDEGFLHSDHNPVRLTFALMK